MDSFNVPVYLFHPMFVHFPIALLILGWVLAMAAKAPRFPSWFSSAATGSLVAGTLALWIALGLGLMAEHFAPHVPPAWRAMASHKQYAWVTAWLFSALSFAWLLSKNRHRTWLLLGWGLTLLSLAYTAHLGAQLVYVYGLGQIQP